MCNTKLYSQCNLYGISEEIFFLILNYYFNPPDVGIKMLHSRNSNIM